MTRFTLSVFLGSFLLFQVQPLVGRMLLPLYGGVPSVWTSCLLFFQCLLFLGYVHAHWLVHRVSLRTQWAWFATLLFGASAIWWLTGEPRQWQAVAVASTPPLPGLMMLLFLLAGAPYFLLTSGGPLIQSWFARTGGSTSPYRLYAISNAGSLLGLITYPLWIEPALSTTAQRHLWGGAFVFWGVLTLITARRMCRGTSQPSLPPDKPSPVTYTAGFLMRTLWVCYSFCACVLLLAMTSHLCQDVAVVPLLWVLPLTIYLFTLILCFHSERWYSRMICLGSLTLSVLALTGARTGAFETAPVSLILLYCSSLFFACMLCHGELARAKPAPLHLTQYYLACAAGGALGGLAVGVLAPFVFESYLELPLGVQACYLLVVTSFMRERGWSLWEARPRPGLCALILVFLALGASLQTALSQFEPGTVEKQRNFFGVVRVVDQGGFHPRRVLFHGTTVHGFEPLDQALKARPTSYYAPSSGVGLALTHYPMRCGRRIGVVGLGVGTLATYGRAGDSMTFYELNPTIVDIAKKHFSYLDSSSASIEIVPGDARLALERDGGRIYDVLIIDAFNSDAVPVHLLTKEAFATYLKHMTPRGLLVVHITNRNLDLVPVVARLAGHFDLAGAFVASGDDPEAGFSSALYAVLASDVTMLAPLGFASTSFASTPVGVRGGLWTDDNHSLISVLKWPLWLIGGK